MTGVAVAFTLLAGAGASASGTELVTLARAMIQYSPGAVPTGIGTLFTTVAIAPPARGPTATSPSTVSPGSSSVASVDRYSREVDRRRGARRQRQVLHHVRHADVGAGRDRPAESPSRTSRSDQASPPGSRRSRRLLFVSLTSSTSPFGCGAARVRAHDQEVRARRRVGRNRHRRRQRAGAQPRSEAAGHTPRGQQRIAARLVRGVGRQIDADVEARAPWDRPGSSRCS